MYTPDVTGGILVAITKYSPHSHLPSLEKVAVELLEEQLLLQLQLAVDTFYDPSTSTILLVSPLAMTS